MLRDLMKAQERDGFHLSLVNPTLTYERLTSLLMQEAWESAFLWEKQVGNSDLASRFRNNARAKAELTHRFQQTLSQVWARRPAVLPIGAVGWFGGVFMAGISLGGSGLSEASDEEVVREFLIRVVNKVQARANPNRANIVKLLQEHGGRLNWTF